MILIFTTILIITLAYALGSISPAWFAGRARGLDLRFEGDESLSFMNAGIILGKPVGVIVFAADLFKGYIAVSGALLFTNSPWVVLLAGIAVVAGQIWPLFHDFSGGKGGATAAGAILAASPWTLIITLTLYALLSAIIGRRAHAEILTITLLPGVAILVARADLALVSLSIALAGLLIVPRWGEVEVLLGVRKANKNGESKNPPLN
ncbi:MAG: glycerol-3-phosphate acyltransferase [Nitrospinaceae bacterium]|nr:glycerol-3-phosphate acyltransferase [Nitrospinaceae bacterium]MBT3434323.1 glycerol-3-phosphate acyltransferase [Nitrospinaceae bacterium]MBT3820089.1 glycerol-3-phosphate acyltransferase [Nitrospinaceae bacterium]MBT4094980.1 glycerol-3-phosphate acyltransferase [Nitrospinaceae bacterium]MBT4432251.1 glycerol-3-phosphate acyltransferase [Nitrospinaceae bacterium]